MTAGPAIPPPAPVRKHRLLVAAIVILTLAYYFWTALCSFPDAPPIRLKGIPETDHFNLLNHGFLKGHLHLDGDVPRALLEAANPYDPASRGDFAVLHDASFYRGKYYIYFGPAPVVTLFLPFTVITGHDLPIPYATWVFCSGAYLALAAIFLFVQRRHFPAASAWTIAAGLIATGAANLCVALLRRPNVWELAGASGLFYFALAMLCLVRALHSNRVAAWSVAGGLALGLAVASRPTYVVCSVVFALPWLLRRGSTTPETHYDFRAVLGAAAGCGAIVFGLLVYNYARFQNPFEFGQKYQLSSIVEGDARHFSLSYVVFNFRIYFLAALRWIGTFPFHDGIVALPAGPAGHGGYEHVFGVLPNLPFTWFGAMALGAAAFFRREEIAPTLRQTLAVTAGAAFLPAGVLLCYFGLCVRYMADFTPWFMMLAAFGLLILEARAPSGFARNGLRSLGLAFAAFSAIAAGLAVVNLYNLAPGTLERRYHPVARALNYPAFAVNLQRWPAPRPLEFELSFPARPSSGREVLLALMRGSRRTAEIGIEYLPDGNARFSYHEASGGTIFSPVVTPVANARHALKLSFGDPAADYDGERFRLHAQFDGRPLWDLKAVSIRAFPAQLVVTPDGRDAFTGKIEATRDIAEADFARPKLGGVRLRVTLTPGMKGHSFPLVVTGRPETGDFLYLQIGKDGRVTLGYDHWGWNGVASPELPVSFDRPHVFECWPPAVVAGSDPLPPEGTLLVKLDGATVWQRTVPFYGATPETFHVGRNPIGGSSCEATFETVIVEETQLPPP